MVDKPTDICGGWCGSACKLEESLPYEVGELVFSYRQRELESIIAFADRSFRTDSLSETGVPPIRQYRAA